MTLRECRALLDSSSFRKSGGPHLLFSPEGQNLEEQGGAEKKRKNFVSMKRFMFCSCYPKKETQVPNSGSKVKLQGEGKNHKFIPF